MSKFTRPYRIEDAPGYVAPGDLWPVVPVTDQGAEATCPRCKTVNKCSFGADGRMEWWADPKKGHCVHFRGMYSTGGFRDVQASFS